MMTRFKQWLCSHRYDLADLRPRDAGGMVSCACRKCGKVNRADCGLHLPGYFDRNTTSARLAAGMPIGVPASDGQTAAASAPAASAVPTDQDESPAEMALRSLAAWLGVGGYNAPTVDAKVFEAKIRDGVQVFSQAHGIAARDLAEQVLHMDMATAKGLRAKELARRVLGILPAASAVPQPMLTDEEISHIALRHGVINNHGNGGYYCMERGTSVPTLLAALRAVEAAVLERIGQAKESSYGGLR